MMTPTEFYKAQGLLTRLGEARSMIQNIGESIAIIVANGSYLPQDVGRLAKPILLSHYHDVVLTLERELLELGVDARKD